MNRVSGWYKRQATKILFVIGLVLAMIFNISTIDIVHKLSVNKDLRETLAKSASGYVEKVNKRSNPDNPIDTGQKQIKNSAESNNANLELIAAQQQISNIKKLYDDSIAQINMMMGLGWDFSKADTNKNHWFVPATMTKNFNKVLYVLIETIKHPKNWLGFLITALAITLGAPFWFDLLNKFINIRAGGNKPSEDANDTGSSSLSKTVTLNQKPAPNSFA
jgi:hypothetical protein